MIVSERGLYGNIYLFMKKLSAGYVFKEEHHATK
jgi:hypothetical protein